METQTAPLAPVQSPVTETDMPQHEGLVLPTLLGALTFGLLADQLLYRAAFGLNIVIVVALFCAGVLWLAWRRGIALHGGGRFFALPALALATGLVLRDTPVLVVFNLLGVLFCLAIFVFRAKATRVRVGSLFDYVAATASSGALALMGALPILPSMRWRGPGAGAGLVTFVRMAIGLLIAAPLLLVFSALFASADPNFDALLRQLFDTSRMVEHAFLIFALAWLCAGALWLALAGTQAQTYATGMPKRRVSFGLGTIEIGIVLGLMNALFAAFVFSQLRYFFGGAALVLDTNDASNALTFSAYARRGFFELVTVSALVLAVLLIGHLVARRDSAGPLRVFKLLALVLIALLFVIMASALHRMWIYMQAYGLTELRVCSTVFMLWLALVFIWFSVTTLRGQPMHFAFGLVISALITLFALNLANPVERIVAYNIERITVGKSADLPGYAAERIDAAYLADLARDNADALPPLMMNLSRFETDDRCKIAAGLAEYYSKNVYGIQTPAGDQNADSAPTLGDELAADWRSWNLARAQARNSISPAVFESYVEMACFSNR
jgi:hypothetical protein